jgi:hypothetical protein
MNISQGSNATLEASFIQYGTGAQINVTGLTIQIVRVVDGITVLGPTSTGVQQLATGLYAYIWSVPVNAQLGDYAAIWAGDYLGQPMQVVDTLAVTSFASNTGQNLVGPSAPWPVTWTCDLSAYSPEITGVALQAATEILYSLTGRRYGTTQMTIRPCRRGQFDAMYPGGGNWWMWGQWPRPLFYSGVWYNITCGNCTGGTCSCNYIDEAWMPSPVSSVDGVMVDGVALNPSAYQLRDYRYLQRIDGSNWPLCNDLTKSDSNVGTWSVTLTLGEAVPQMGQIAVGELACQFVKLLANDSSCTLPKPVQQLVRQGVTMNFLDPNQIFANGRVGLYMCDMFIASQNPHALMERARSYDVDGDAYSILGGP